MEFQAANEKFLAIEDKFDVFEISINGIQVWDFIRLAVSDQIRDASRNQKSIRRDTSSGAENSRLQKWITKNPFISPQKDIIFYSHGRRKRLHDGLWWDIYIDPILDNCDLDHLCLENNGDSNHPEPTKTTNVKYNDPIHDISDIYRRVSNSDSSISSDEKNQLKEINYHITDEFGVNPKLVERVNDVVRKVKTTTPVYTAWLRKVDPNAVVTWARPRYLIYACKQLGIPVIELQHGVIHRYQYDYSYPSTQDVTIFPDYLFTFGEHWKNTVEYPISQDRIRVTGHPFAKRQYEKYKNRKNKKQILFLSQPSIGTRLSQFATNYALNHNDYKVVYKLHPREEGHWKSDYPWLQDTDIQIASTEDLPLYALLAESAVQVGVTSTALYEGTIFDTETYILDHENLKQVRYLIDNGAKLIESSADLESYLNKDADAVVEGKGALLLTEEEVVEEEIESLVALEER